MLSMDTFKKRLKEGKKMSKIKRKLIKKLEVVARIEIREDKGDFKNKVMVQVSQYTSDGEV